MFDHIMLKVKDLNSSKRFYSAALAPLGFSVQYDADGIVVFGPKDAPALCLAKGTDRTCPCCIRGQEPRCRPGILRRRSAGRRKGQWQTRPPAPISR